LLALAVGGHNAAVGLNARHLVEERAPLPRPDVEPRRVEDVHQPLDVRSSEASTEVAGRRGVRDRSRTHQIEERRVVAPDLDVVKDTTTSASALNAMLRMGSESD